MIVERPDKVFIDLMIRDVTRLDMLASFLNRVTMVMTYHIAPVSSHRAGMIRGFESTIMGYCSCGRKSHIVVVK